MKIPKNLLNKDLILILSLIIPFITIPFIKPICIMTGIGKFSNLIFSYLAPMLAFVILMMLIDYCLI